MKYPKSETKRVMSRGYSGELSSLDIDQGQILLSTWSGIIEEVCPDLQDEFIFYLKQVGLFTAINEAKAELTSLRSGTCSTKGIFHAILLQCNGDEKLATILLGFPVRFTLSENPSQYAATVSKFFDTNSDVRAYDSYGVLFETQTADGYSRHAIPSWFLDSLKAIGETILRDWRNKYRDTFWKIPNGATYECPRAASAAKKLLAATRYGFTLDGYVNCPPDATAFDDSCIVRWDKYHETATLVPFRENVSRMEVVPKNYEELRTIAVEETYRQLHLGRLGDSMMKCYDEADPAINSMVVNGSSVNPAGCVTFHDQSRNQLLARKGSITGELATIDFSHASDSISSTIAWYTLPNELYEQIMHYRANRIEVDGKRRYLNIFSTMGSRVTFPLETHIFWCIAMVTRLFAKRWYKIDTRIQDYSVYGDDVIVPSSVAELFIDFAKLAGFTPNTGKSFWTGSYRESCGMEYYHGIDAQGKYWPRAVVDISTMSGLASMIELQHRLVSNFPRTARVLASVLISRYPNLTYNEIGTDADCIWSAFPPLQEKHIDIGDIHMEAVKVSRFHTYIKPTGLTTQEVAAGEALAYVHQLRGDRVYNDSLSKILDIPDKTDHRVFTNPVETSLRSRYEFV